MGVFGVSISAHVGDLTGYFGGSAGVFEDWMRDFGSVAMNISRCGAGPSGRGPCLWDARRRRLARFPNRQRRVTRSAGSVGSARVAYQDYFGRSGKGLNLAR